ncbi:sigma-70 family RNA polymerase sigma factor [Streptomyces sp. NPDC057291]|uniref:sigma-70 family RNA polymerase sigma factor n=1 Tax=Streptomyces sp. NPDC057291 TaxID=3346087 RepID=UPI00363829E6
MRAKSSRVNDVATALENDDAEGVLRALEPMIRHLAHRIGGQLPYEEEIAQAGRVAVWESMNRFYGEPEEFRAYAWTTAKGAMADARRELQYPDMSPHVMKHFEWALRLSGGDPVDVEAFMASAAMPKWRATVETARDARLAWEGVRPLLEHDVAPPMGEASQRDYRHLWALLWTLSERQLTVLAMTYGLGLHGRHSDQEIAAALGWRKSSVVSTRSSAMRRLKAAAA